MNIISKRKYFLSFSATLVIAGLIAIVVLGFNLGVDFEGGTMWQIKLVSSEKRAASSEELKNFFETDLGIKNAAVFPSDDSFLVRFGHIDEQEHAQYLLALSQKFGEIEEARFESIGPTIGSELRQRAIRAIVFVLLGISLYIAYAFRKVSYPIKSYKYGIITLITLFHDIIIPAGVFAFLGWKFGVEIDTNFVVALLVVMGFSVHDTIVVFDRIRENLLISSKLGFDEIVNNSIRQTLARSINTSFTLILVLLALLFFGPATLKYFILTMLIGTVFGTYSSIFVASPLLTIWNKYSKVK